MGQRVPLAMGSWGFSWSPHRVTDPAQCRINSGGCMVGEGASHGVSVCLLVVFVYITFYFSPQSLSKNVSLAAGCSRGIPRL